MNRRCRAIPVVTEALTKVLNQLNLAQSAARLSNIALAEAIGELIVAANAIRDQARGSHAGQADNGRHTRLDVGPVAAASTRRRVAR